MDGLASIISLPLKFFIARTLPPARPAIILSPRRKVPACTKAVATGPSPLSIWASIIVPTANRLGLAVNFSKSANNKTISSSVSKPVRCLAEIGTQIVLPPQSSGNKFNSASCFFNFSISASALSTLFMAIKKGNFSRWAISKASMVCGWTPSSAAITIIATSASLPPRDRMAAKASWPGVSKKVIRRSLAIAW